MLILTRKCNEQIHIGEDIVVKVIRTGKNSVKIGIEAPADVRVLRSELLDQSDSGADGEDDQNDLYLCMPYPSVA